MMEAWRKSHQDGCPVYYAQVPIDHCTCIPSYKAEPPPEKLHGSPVFYKLLDEMRETHNKKSHDYAPDSDPYANYKFAGLVSSMFSHSPDDAGFAGRLAEKLVRLSVLGKRGTQPLNESIADTERDIAVIAALWMAMRREKYLLATTKSEEELSVHQPITDWEVSGYGPPQTKQEGVRTGAPTPLGGIDHILFSKAATLIDLATPQTKKEIFEYLSVSLRSFTPDSATDRPPR